MSSFITPQYATVHPGVQRFESALQGARQLAQIMSTWRLATAWFALSGAVLQAIYKFKGALDSWARHQAQLNADRRLWVIAKTDGRVMAELQAAQSHSGH